MVSKSTQRTKQKRVRGGGLAKVRREAQRPKGLASRSGRAALAAFLGARAAQAAQSPDTRPQGPRQKACAKFASARAHLEAWPDNWRSLFDVSSLCAEALARVQTVMESTQGVLLVANGPVQEQLGEGIDASGVPVVRFNRATSDVAAVGRRTSLLCVHAGAQHLQGGELAPELRPEGVPVLVLEDLAPRRNDALRNDWTFCLRQDCRPTAQKSSIQFSRGMQAVLLLRRLGLRVWCVGFGGRGHHDNGAQFLTHSMSQEQPLRHHLGAVPWVHRRALLAAEQATAAATPLATSCACLLGSASRGPAQLRLSAHEASDGRVVLTCLPCERALGSVKMHASGRKKDVYRLATGEVLKIEYPHSRGVGSAELHCEADLAARAPRLLPRTSEPGTVAWHGSAGDVDVRWCVVQEFAPPLAGWDVQCRDVVEDLLIAGSQLFLALCAEGVYPRDFRMSNIGKTGAGEWVAIDAGAFGQADLRSMDHVALVAGLKRLFKECRDFGAQKTTCALVLDMLRFPRSFGGRAAFRD